MPIKKTSSAVALIFCGAMLLTTTGCQTTPRDERSAGRALDDHEITASIKDSLLREPVYKFNDVDVRTFAGTVELSGFVNSEEQKRRAGEIASQVPGVAQVHNALLMKSFAPVPTPTGRSNEPNRIYSSPPPQPNGSENEAPDRGESRSNGSSRKPVIVPPQ